MSELFYGYSTKYTIMNKPQNDHRIVYYVYFIYYLTVIRLGFV